ncbi:MAG: twin-arginine translocation signal domain-containing protein, partial [Planctomycetes bacterium]|nr:twin-arginine translocation signal domain-containing protein [Planctomycetota bacterium]
MTQFSRRTFLETAAAAGLTFGTGWNQTCRVSAAEKKNTEKKGAGIRYGLVTYQWGKDWDLPTLLQNCEKAKVLGV